MIRRQLLVAAAWLTACAHADPVPPAEAVNPRLKLAVEFLASDELAGRAAGTPGCERAAQWMAERFREIGLRPAESEGLSSNSRGSGVEGFFQRFKAGEKSAVNVLGLLPGTGSELVVLCAHHDHLGAKDGAIYYGANDNASGCALLLEIARIATATGPRARGILFCSFDAEERGLGGSHHFVRSNLVETSRIASMACMDMVGADFFPGDTEGLYALGAENSPELGAVLDREPVPAGLDVRRFGISVIEPFGEMLPRSDYGSFRGKGIPFIFFSTGQPWHYHTPEDTPARLNFDKMERIRRYIAGVVLRMADLAQRPRYVRQAEPRLWDLKEGARVVRLVLKHSEEMGLGEAERVDLEGIARDAEGIVRSGHIGPNDQAKLQKMGMTLLRIASLRPKVNR